MKICMITTIASTLQNFVLETAKYLYEQLGYEVTLISNDDENFSNNLPKYLKFIPVKMERGVNLGGIKAINELRKIFKREKFDMVQYSTPNASFYASIAGKLAKVPIRLYGQWGMRYVGFSGVKRTIFKFLEKIVCINSTYIFSVSQLNRNFAIEEKLYKNDKVEVVGNGGTIGVDCSVYDIGKKQNWREEIRKKYKILDSDFVYGFSGRITADKGCKELLSVMKNFEGKCKNLKLLIIGELDYNCNIPLDLINWAKESECIIFAGRVSKEQMPKYYSAIDVLVHPTYREGFGMVIQEAGALAIPVITTKIPGASEVMVENQSCLLVEPKNEKDLEKKMIQTSENKEQLNLLGVNAYKRTITLYERKIMLENQKSAYEKLLSGDLKNA